MVLIPHHVSTQYATLLLQFPFKFDFNIFLISHNVQHRLDPLLIYYLTQTKALSPYIKKSVFFFHNSIILLLCFFYINTTMAKQNKETHKMPFLLCLPVSASTYLLTHTSFPCSHPSPALPLLWLW